MDSFGSFAWAADLGEVRAAGSSDGETPLPARGDAAGPERGALPGATPPFFVAATSAAAAGTTAVALRPAVTRLPKLSKDAYRRQRATLDAELTRLGLRKNHLELAMGDPAAAANFVELRRITSELADVTAGLEAAEEAWLELEDRAP